MTRHVVASNRVMNLWRTVIGKKMAMAVTGAVLVGFVIAHMPGNLRDPIRAISRRLREPLGPPGVVQQPSDERNQAETEVEAG